MPVHTSPVALVTGAGRGIGKGIVRRLAEDGYAVAINYASSRAPAEALAASIQSDGGAALAIRADVGAAGDRGKLMDSVLQKWGRLDVLVNNAGITSIGRKDVLEATEEGWDRVFATNLKGAFFLSQLASRAMIDLRKTEVIERGTIINLSSVSAYAISLNRADYCMTKAAVSTMTQLFAARLAEEGIMVFEVSPGIIRSDMTAPVKEKYDRLIAEGLTPIRRWGEASDVADTISTLVQGGLVFCTGQCIHVDGGFHIRTL